MLRAAFAGALLAAMVLLSRLPDGVGLFEPSRLTLSYGFLLLEAYVVGELFVRFRLPRITGYIAAGVLFGPSGLGLIGPTVAVKMKLIDDLALAVIALLAGAELHLPLLRSRWRTMGWVTGLLVVFGAGGLAVSFWILGDLFPFLAGNHGASRAAVALVAAAVAASCSPAATIGVIQGCRARGPFTDTVLGVTVAMDALIILVFAVAVALAEAASHARAPDSFFLATVTFQLVASVGAGVVVGGGLAQYVRRVDRDLPIAVIVLAFLVAESCRWLSHAVAARYGLSFHLEPILVLITAGFVVQNFSREGEGLCGTLHAIATPIFVIFFSMTGVTLDLGVLAATWVLAFAVVTLRAGLVTGGAYLGATAAGEDRSFAALSGLGFLSQAGISLGLAHEVARRFPGWGPEASAFLVACITLNELLGPVAFQFALRRRGEAAPEPREEGGEG